jgi:ribosomal protein S12 methylthiotransferase accessory factor
MTVADPAGNLARLMELVSPRVGLIRSVGPVQRGANHPSPPIVCQATLSHYDYCAVPARDRQAGGKGRSEAEAMAGAIGEALERYCAAQPDARRLRRMPWRDAGANAIAPPDCVLYSETQYAQPSFAWHRHDPADEVTCVAARELPHEREILVPASLAYLAMPDLRREDAFAMPTSSGLAAGPDLERAVLGGLCELVERDAFLLTWMARLPAPEVILDTDRGLIRSIRAHYARFGVELRVFRLVTDVELHAMMAIALDKTGQGPASVLALGCHADPAAAALKSVFEICQIMPGAWCNFHDDPPAARLKSPRDVKTLEDHCAWLTVSERLGELAFLLDSSRKVALDALPNFSAGSTAQDLARCVATLAAAGCRVAYADLTTSDLRDFPIRVVRAFATGLQPVHFGWGEERLGGRRLFELPRKLGFTAHVLGESDLNPCPHPLA